MHINSLTLNGNIVAISLLQMSAFLFTPLKTILSCTRVSFVTLTDEVFILLSYSSTQLLQRAFVNTNASTFSNCLHLKRCRKWRTSSFSAQLLFYLNAGHVSHEFKSETLLVSFCLISLSMMSFNTTPWHLQQRRMKITITIQLGARRIFFHFLSPYCFSFSFSVSVF